MWSEEIVPRIRAAQAERGRRLVGKEGVVASIEAMLFEADPVGINFEHNTDEYRAEAETTITPRLPEAESADDLQRIVHEEFVSWFPAETAGPADRYRRLSRAIWDAHRPYPELST